MRLPLRSGSIESNGDAKVVSHHDVVVGDGIIVVGELSGHTFPFPVPHDPLRARFLDGVVVRCCWVAMDVGSVMG